MNLKSFTAASLLSLIGCSNNPEINKEMQGINQSLRKAQAATDVETFSTHARELSAQIRQAATKQFVGAEKSQRTYEEGMRELTAEVASLDAAVSAKDLAAGQAALERLMALRKKYHLALGI